MNKQELIRRIAADSELTQRDATVMLDNTLEIIMSTVAAGEKIQLSGFGTFESRERGARVGYNPGTHAMMEISAATVPVFRPGVIFKEKVDR